MSIKVSFHRLKRIYFHTVPPPDDINIYKIVGIVCGFIVMVGVAIFFVSFYKNKKNAMFNEIPTVCIKNYSVVFVNVKVD